MIDLGLLDKVLSALVDAIFSVLIEDVAQQPKLAAFRERLTGPAPEKRAMKEAIANGYGEFACEHPDLAESLLDPTYLADREVARELAKLLHAGQYPDVQRLADIWRKALPGWKSDLVPGVTALVKSIEGGVRAQLILQPFVTNQFLDAITLLMAQQVQADQTQVQQGDVTNQLLQQILDSIQQGKTRQQFTQADAPPEETQNRPGALSAIFAEDPDDLIDKPRKLIGRDEALKQVTELLAAKERVLLQGFAGEGKTALAATIAAEWVKQGKGNVLWLKAGNSTIEALYEALARAFGLSQEMARTPDANKPKALRQLIQQKGITLLALDDCWSGSALSDLISALPAGLPMLATARQRYPGKRVPVQELARENALELLGDQADLNMKAVPEADKLCEVLSDHAFSLRIAGRILNSRKPDQPPQGWMPGKMVEELVKEIEDKPHTVHDEFAQTGRENVAKLIEVSLDALDEGSRTVFWAFGAFFTPQVTEELLALFFLRNVQDNLSVDKSLATLALQGLATHIPPTENAITAYSLHDLAYSYARTQKTDKERQYALDACLNYVEKYTEYSFDNYSALRPILETLISAADWALTHRWSDAFERLVRVMHGRGILSHEGYFAKGLELLQTAFLLVDKHEIQVQSNLLGDIGTLYRQTGQYAKALQCHNKALRLSRRNRNKHSEAQDLNNIGLVYLDLGKFQKAKRYFHQAMGFAIKSEFWPLVIGIRGNLGMVSRNLKQFDEAIEHLEEALRLGWIMDENEYEANNLESLGNVYNDLEDLEKAIEYYEKTLQIRREAGSIPHLAHTLANYAGALVGIGEHEKAKQYSLESLELSLKTNSPKLEAMASSSLGAAYFGLRNYRQAIVYYQRARSIFKELGMVSDQSELLDTAIAKAKANLDEHE